jgi:hypothetical protein
MRFSVRDLLLLTVIAAIATGWAIDRWRLASRAKEFENRARLLMLEGELTRAQALLERNNAQAARQRAFLAEAEDRYFELSREVEPAASK